ncbi:hypothetical protein [Magnetospira sp. QH-2]|uniref:hypothetical protein n=1 Tax=Magnetospira sp. (strain QH-2) TaxID=1288970 RepID=UPI0003E80CF3|nr:hypothetical protein [Magnetospira sp. QH-2]CCQ74988.1 exported protein of unknown function [Magnetospira sp. QH-2]
MSIRHAILPVLFGLSLLLWACDPTGPASGLVDGLPEAPNREARYLFLLGTPGEQPTGPGQALADKGLLVVAPKAGSEGISRPVKVRHWIRELLALGVPEDRISVVGLRSGGADALEVSAMVKIGDMAFVLVEACALGNVQQEEAFADLIDVLGRSLRGRILSLRAEEGVASGSCASLFERAPFAETWETEFTDEGWVKPLLDWVDGGVG